MNQIVSDAADDVHSYLILIELKPSSVSLEKGMLIAHYSSSEEALNESMRVLGGGNFVQLMDVDMLCFVIMFRMWIHP